MLRCSSLLLRPLCRSCTTFCPVEGDKNKMLQKRKIGNEQMGARAWDLVDRLDDNLRDKNLQAVISLIPEWKQSSVFRIHSWKMKYLKRVTRLFALENYESGLVDIMKLVEDEKEMIEKTYISLLNSFRLCKKVHLTDQLMTVIIQRAELTTPICMAALQACESFDEERKAMVVKIFKSGYDGNADFYAFALKNESFLFVKQFIDEFLPSNNIPLSLSLCHILLHKSKLRSREEKQKIFQMIENEGFSPNSYTINALVGAQEHELAWRCYKMLQDKGEPIPVKTKEILIRSCTNFERAKEIFETTIETQEPTIITFNAMIHVASKVQKSDFFPLLQRDMEKFGISPDKFTYNMFISFFSRRNITKALELKQEMIDAGIQPDAYTYNSLISVFEYRKNPEEIQKLVEEARSMNVYVSTKPKNHANRNHSRIKNNIK